MTPTWGAKHSPEMYARLTNRSKTSLGGVSATENERPESWGVDLDRFLKDRKIFKKSQKIDTALQHVMFEKASTSKYPEVPIAVRALVWTKQNFEV